MAKNTPSGSTAAGEPTKKPKKRRWYHNVADAYKLTAKIIPDTKFWVWGLFFGILALFIVLGIVTGRWIMLPILGLSLAVMAAMGALAFKANKARYRQIDGQLGAVGALLNEGRRGWSTSADPVAINARHRDLVYRVVGRPGVVLISEGAKGRVTRMIEDEKRKITRIMPEVPVDSVQVGNDEGQVNISRMWKTVTAYKGKLTAAEISTVAKRLDSIAAARQQLPIPKGIDPMKARPNRRALRGR